jgi:2-polyprenyl-3-methyl-5-hydroxy-6-metoxy-1,4-benzoquinol methylase
MNNLDEFKCQICDSKNIIKINTYKHYVCACNDCNNISHIKKTKYLLEYILPRSLFRRLLPEKAFLRIFRDDGSFVPSEFYDVYADECVDLNERRISELSQVVDQLALAKIDPSGMEVLDVSGGPGYVGHMMKESYNCKRVVVTEYSETSAKTMEKNLDIETVKFDYTSDNLVNLVEGKFDLIMVRSSIIFCPNLDEFIFSLREKLSDNGFIMIETIVPSLGEIYWWQQLEYKFPFIYSQETIEKLFYKNGFSFLEGFRDYGNYIGVKNRSYDSLGKKMFTWVFEYPMLLLYRAILGGKRPPIDNKMSHKMLTQIWQKRESAVGVQLGRYSNYNQGKEYKSKTFGYVYNGYLEKK